MNAHNNLESARAAGLDVDGMLADQEFAEDYIRRQAMTGEGLPQEPAQEKPQDQAEDEGRYELSQAESHAFEALGRLDDSITAEDIANISDPAVMDRLAHCAGLTREGLQSNLEIALPVIHEALSRAGAETPLADPDIAAAFQGWATGTEAGRQATAEGIAHLWKTGRTAEALGKILEAFKTANAGQASS